MATAELVKDPALSYGEWSDRIKDRLVSQRFEYPDYPHAITHAMHAAEHTYERAHGPRPAPIPPSKKTMDPIEPGRDLSREEARALLAKIAPAGIVKSMPRVKRISPHRAACVRALRMVASEMRDTIARCEAAERAAREEHEP